MSVHGVAMATYRSLKTIPVVGRGARWAAGKAKTALASWHYSNNRLRDDLMTEAASGASKADAPGAVGRDARDPSERLEQLSRRLAIVEARETGPRSHATERVVVVLTDRDGTSTELTRGPSTDLSRYIPPVGLTELRVVDPDGTMAPDELVGLMLPKFASYVGAGASLVWSGRSLIWSDADLTSPDRALIRLGEAMRGMRYAPIPDPATIADAMREVGLIGVSVAREHGTYRVSASREAHPGAA